MKQVNVSDAGNESGSNDKGNGDDFAPLKPMQRGTTRKESIRRRETNFKKKASSMPNVNKSEQEKQDVFQRQKSSTVFASTNSVLSSTTQGEDNVELETQLRHLSNATGLKERQSLQRMMELDNVMERTVGGGRSRRPTNSRLLFVRLRAETDSVYSSTSSFSSAQTTSTVNFAPSEAMSHGQLRRVTEGKVPSEDRGSGRDAAAAAEEEEKEEEEETAKQKGAAP